MNTSIAIFRIQSLADIRGSYRLVKSINKTLTLIEDKLQQSADNSANSCDIDSIDIANIDLAKRSWRIFNVLTKAIYIEWYSCGDIQNTDYRSEIWVPVKEINQ